MKSNRQFTTAILTLVLFGCASTDHSDLYGLSSNKGWEATVAPEEVHSYIPWEAAVDLIMDGEVLRVDQAHSLQVGLKLKDGSYWSSIQPDIDTVIILVNKCGRKCRRTMVRTE